MDTTASDFLGYEARALSRRLAQVQPFALTEVMVPAASIPRRAHWMIERHMDAGRRELHLRIRSYLGWLASTQGRFATATEGQRRFVQLRIRFNRVLTQFDLFADALSQRSERENGVWLAGLDAIAADALALPRFFDSPPVLCYLDRGAGAAIRRARTRLPGGGSNPVAIIRVPRERMVGNGIASSLVHEVGHQAAALLGLVPSLRLAIRQRREQTAGLSGLAWHCFERWISEIVADFWSVARVGVVSTLGLFGVVSLPSAFVFRIQLDEPHPFPWIRVLLSCAIGRALYPDPQWDRLAALWQGFYPITALDGDRRALLRTLEANLPDFVDLLLNHRPPSLAQASLAEVMDIHRRRPQRLRTEYLGWRGAPGAIYRLPPTIALAAIGQLRADGAITAERESQTVARLLTHWALRGALQLPQQPRRLGPSTRPRNLQPAAT